MSELKYIPIYPDWVEMMLTKDTSEKQLAFILAIFDYALLGKVPPSPREMENPRGVDYAARDGYLTAKSQLDYVLTRMKAGASGGRAGKGTPRNQGNKNAVKTTENKSKTKAKQKQNESKSIAKQNHNINIILNKTNKERESIEREKENDALSQKKENEELKKLCGGWVDDNAPNLEDPILPSRELMELYAHNVSVPVDYLDTFLTQMKDIGWQYVNRGGTVVRLSHRNFKSVLKSFYKQDQVNKNQPEGVVHHQGGYDASKRLGL